MSRNSGHGLLTAACCAALAICGEMRGGERIAELDALAVGERYIFAVAFDVRDENDVSVERAEGETVFVVADKTDAAVRIMVERSSIRKDGTKKTDKRKPEFAFNLDKADERLVFEMLFLHRTDLQQVIRLINQPREVVMRPGPHGTPVEVERFFGVLSLKMRDADDDVVDEERPVEILLLNGAPFMGVWEYAWTERGSKWGRGAMHVTARYERVVRDE